MTEDALQLFSTSQASAKSKRHSLNIISPGPRPFHLTSGSILSSPSYSPSRSPALHGPSANSSVSGTPLFLTGPLSPDASSIKNGRRQSSISYLPSNRDRDRPIKRVSPSSPTGFSRGIDLTSSNSTAAGISGVEMLEGSRVTSGATSTVKQSKGRPPATLAEKHAELLHFIAQKESKCLELRSQLAIHEAELLQLKRKWERIVNRRFQKSSSSSFPSPSSPSSTAPISYLYPSTLPTGAASSSSGVVLEGIKEGVQGMGRLITAGLGSIAQVGVAEGNTSVSSPTSTLSPTLNRSKSSKFPTPLRLGSGNNYGHESQSSSSTSASITTVASSSSTSATSFMLDHGTTQVPSPPPALTADEVSNEYDEFGDFKEAPTQSLNEPPEQEENPEQVLMVHDTGATPTMSPNPHFQRRNQMKVEQKDPTCNISGSDAAWDDGWTTSGTLTTAVDSLNDFTTNSDSQARRSSVFPVTHAVQPARTKPPSLPGVSSIPGLASLSVPMNGATPQSMSAWVGSMGKKWGEIRESQTFTKSQKRASILLSDVSQSIVSALISPTPLSASSRSVTTSKSPVENPFAANILYTPSNPPSPSIDEESTITTNKNEVPTSTSLLDDLDIGEVDESAKLGIGSPVLIPDLTSKNTPNPGTKLEARVGQEMNIVPSVPSSNSIDDEDWNW